MVLHNYKGMSKWYCKGYTILHMFSRLLQILPSLWLQPFAKLCKLCQHILTSPIMVINWLFLEMNILMAEISFFSISVTVPSLFAILETINSWIMKLYYLITTWLLCGNHQKCAHVTLSAQSLLKSIKNRNPFCIPIYYTNSRLGSSLSAPIKSYTIIVLTNMPTIFSEQETSQNCQL